MPEAVSIRDAIASLPMLRDRRPDTEETEVGSAFATLAETSTGGVFAGSFQGEGAWERHPNGDELVQILDGETQLTLIVDGIQSSLEMKAGMLTIVPQGCWHKFNSENGVSLMTMTPQPTEHSTDETPNDV